MQQIKPIGDAFLFLEKRKEKSVFCRFFQLFNSLVINLLRKKYSGPGLFDQVFFCRHAIRAWPYWHKSGFPGLNHALC